MTSLQIALIAGLSGSVATAFLNFFVQHLLAKRRHKEEEQRLAFVYLIKVSGLLATEQIIKNMLEVFANVLTKFLPDQMGVLKSKEGTYEPSHIICVAISRALKEVNAENQNFKGYQSRFSLMELGSTDLIEEFRIPFSLLSQMPHHAILAYENLIGSLNSLRTTWYSWKAWMSKPDEMLIRPDTLFAQWLGIQSLSKDASELRKALITAGQIGKNEADAVLKNQVDRLWKILREISALESKLKAAEEPAGKLLPQKADESVKSIQEGEKAVQKSSNS